MKPGVSSISRLYRKTSDRCYVSCKLRTDPLYQAVADALENTDHPLLDIGCGLGLLAFFLRSRDLGFPVTGLDYDARKISSAREATALSGETHLDFHEFDARQPLPPHTGNVTILDILQFFQPSEQETLLRRAAACLPPGGKLVIRSGLRDDSLRFKITHAADVFAKVSFWMKSAPVHYPTADFFQDILAPSGTLRITPLWGNTPFNNHLVVLRKNGCGSGP